MASLRWRKMENTSVLGGWRARDFRARIGYRIYFECRPICVRDIPNWSAIIIQPDTPSGSRWSSIELFQGHFASSRDLEALKKVCEQHYTEHVMSLLEKVALR